jgi:hypothetical protein
MYMAGSRCSHNLCKLKCRPANDLVTANDPIMMIIAPPYTRPAEQKLLEARQTAGSKHL